MVIYALKLHRFKLCRIRIIDRNNIICLISFPPVSTIFLIKVIKIF